MGLLDFMGFGQADKVLDIADKATSGIVKGIDALVFTDEEKSQAGAKITDAHIKLMETLAGENTARSVTRRYIACSFVFTYLAGNILSVGLWKFDQDYASFIFDCTQNLNNAILGILIFYFGYYGVKSVMKK